MQASSPVLPEPSVPRPLPGTNRFSLESGRVVGFNLRFANPMWPAIQMVPDLGSISFPLELMALS
jgi:hypothetical protein